MNRRLQQFLELENLSPARLADILEVQRSGMSHLLSGRNKPGYDFILKLLTKFPQLSADWFITGKGKPYKQMNDYSSPATPSKTPSQNLQLSQNNLPDSGIVTKVNPTSGNNVNSVQNNNMPEFGIQENQSQNFEQKSDIDENLFSFEAVEQQNSQYPDFREENAKAQSRPHIANNESVAPILKREHLSENQINTAEKADSGKKRSVKRVIIFYNDGSFEELYP